MNRTKIPDVKTTNHEHDHDHNHSHSHSHDHPHDHDNESPPSSKNRKLEVGKDEVLTTFKVSNMDCADEIKAINEALKIEGVVKIQANLMASTVQIVHSSTLSPAFLKKRIETTVVRVENEDNQKESSTNRHRIFLVGASGFFLSLGLMLSWLGNNGPLIQISYYLAIAFGGVLVFPKAVGALKRKTLDMNVLMAIAVGGAVAIGEISEAAAVVFLFSFSELLESLSVQRARRAIQELLKITPQKANLIQETGSVVEVGVEEVGVSQVIRVKSGESIPLDGVVISGTSSVNQAPLTGEAIPVTKTLGDTVFAGTINQESSLDIRVTEKFSDTKIAKVINLVEEAQSQRAVSQKFVDRFAEIYTPTVLVLAILTVLIPPLLFGGLWYPWIYKALVLLVIACPCALVISTPVSIVSGLTALAKKGVLVKGGSVLEVLGKIKALAVDKTGTLTEGKPKLHQIIRINSFNDNQIIEIANSLEAHSTHPLAQAVNAYATERNIPTKRLSNFANISGRGVEASIDGHKYFLGNHKFAHEIGVCTPELEKTLQTLEEQSFSVIVVGHQPHDNCAGEVIGVIALGDSIRTEVSETLKKIKSTGVERIVLLSGDNQKTATAIGAMVGVDESFGDLLPEDKVKHIEKLKAQFGVVAMIGDGVNDAPAMAKSSVGIAMGFVGSDTAIETADMTLMTDDLKQVALAIRAGRRTLSVIKFNIGFALVTKAIFLVLTFLGFSNLWLAVAADTGAALLVILNSLRLLKLKE
jgi:Zn2+/Cd2+-exporting ATPase